MAIAGWRNEKVRADDIKARGVNSKVRGEDIEASRGDIEARRVNNKASARNNGASRCDDEASGLGKVASAVDTGARALAGKPGGFDIKAARRDRGPRCTGCRPRAAGIGSSAGRGRAWAPGSPPRGRNTHPSAHHAAGQPRLPASSPAAGRSGSRFFRYKKRIRDAGVFIMLE